jgi:hypothetical protein
MSDPAALSADSAAMLAADDWTFQEWWGALGVEGRDSLADDLRAQGYERYRALTPYIGKTLQRLERVNGADVYLKPPEVSPPPQPLDFRELAKREAPARVWALFLWIALHVPTLLVGPAGAGKTLLAMQLAASFALARSFVDKIENALTVLMWACEDDADELWRRMVAIAQWLGVRLEDFADKLVIVPRLGFENTLYSTEFGRPMFTPVFEQLRQQASDLNSAVVILDNVAQIFGGNENSRHEVTHFLNALMGALAGRTPILLAHPSRTTGSEYSGSSAWEAVARTRLYLGHKLPDQQGEEEPDDQVRYLARRKANYSARDWRRFEFRNGVLVPDAIEIGGGLMNGLREQKAERVVLDGLRRLAAMSVHATDAGNSPRFLPKLLLDYKLSEGCTKRDLANAMRQAMLDGKIARGVVGKYQNRLPQYGLIASV